MRQAAALRLISAFRRAGSAGGSAGGRVEPGPAADQPGEHAAVRRIARAVLHHLRPRCADLTFPEPAATHHPNLPSQGVLLSACTATHRIWSR